MRFWVFGLDGKNFGDEINSMIILTNLMGDHTKHMQGNKVIGVGLQYLLIDVLSLREAARSVMLNCNV